MKKNKLLIILITILFLPFSINAVVRNNYDITKENTNLYINDFSRNNIYIIKNTSSFNVPFIYNNGTLSVDTYFKNGGLLNRYEFLISKSLENDTYLFNGNNYWTLTSSGDKVYMLIDEDNKIVASIGKISGKYTAIDVQDAVKDPQNVYISNGHQYDMSQLIDEKTTGEDIVNAITSIDNYKDSSRFIDEDHGHDDEDR